MEQFLRANQLATIRRVLPWSKGSKVQYGQVVDSDAKFATARWSAPPERATVTTIMVLALKYQQNEHQHRHSGQE